MLKIYEIRVGGRLGQDWADWFEGFSIRQEENEVTVLVGPVVDQSALFGVIARIRDLNLPLLSINPKGEES